jgi:hypothetical protein
MGQLTAKLLTSFFYSWLGGGAIMQIPIMQDLIKVDEINTVVYHVVLAITFVLWATKYAVGIWSKYRDTKNKKY